MHIDPFLHHHFVVVCSFDNYHAFDSQESTPHWIYLSGQLVIKSCLLPQLQVSFKSLVMSLQPVDVLSVAISIPGRGDIDLLHRMWRDGDNLKGYDSMRSSREDSAGAGVVFEDETGNLDYDCHDDGDGEKELWGKEPDPSSLPISPIHVYSDAVAAGKHTIISLYNFVVSFLSYLLLFHYNHGSWGRSSQ